MGRNTHLPGCAAAGGPRYTSIPMDRRRRGLDPGVVTALHLHHVRRPGDARREPPRALAEHAGDLLLAARGLRAMAGADGTLPAVAATLGCVETTIDALADAVEQLLDAAGEPEADPRRAAERRAETARTLRVARDLTGALRERVGPELAEPSA